jgi:hypothetical protein
MNEDAREPLLSELDQALDRLLDPTAPHPDARMALLQLLRRIGPFSDFKGRARFYRLERRRPVEIGYEEWARDQDQVEADCIIAQTMVGDYAVFTSFDTIVRGPRVGAPPRLFETVVFAPDTRAIRTRRSATWDQAMNEHRAEVAALKAAKEVVDSVMGKV